MTIQEMKARKHELGLSNQELSRRSGVPLGTLQKIFSGKTTSPREQTILALEKVLAPAQMSCPAGAHSGIFRESPLAWGRAEHDVSTASSGTEATGTPSKKQGEYTIEDYYAIPDERRVELIDGVIYDMAAPTYMHQIILGQLYLQFSACAGQHSGDCEVVLSPCDVRLDNDDRTMVQPDLFVLCHEADIARHDIPGAPDLVVEIVSPSSRARDMILKMGKYYDAGVREYWIVDPKRRKVYVYCFEMEDFGPEVYSFDEQVPIHISGGECSIDFAKIRQRLDR